MQVTQTACLHFLNFFITNLGLHLNYFNLIFCFMEIELLFFFFLDGTQV